MIEGQDMSKIVGYDSDKDALVVNTFGIRSDVTRFTDKGHDETVGHVLFIDTDHEDMTEVYEESKRLLDLFFMLESSGKGYHVISPVVRSCLEVKELMDRFEYVDERYVNIGWDKRAWTLRAGGKGHKNKPEYVKAYNNEEREPRLLSRPHLLFLESWYDIQHAYGLRLHERVAGDGLKGVSYYTYQKNGER